MSAGLLREDTGNSCYHLAIRVCSRTFQLDANICRAPERLLLHSSSPDLCPHLQPGSVAEDPPLLRSKNGVLEVEFSYRTSLDQNGNPKFCYITPDMQQSPTLQLDLGDTLKIHLTNDVPASVNISDYGTQVGWPICTRSPKAVHKMLCMCNWFNFACTEGQCYGLRLQRKHL